jgi:hypothetical protein
MEFLISNSIAITDNNIELRTELKTEEIEKILKKRFTDIKQLCFCMNDIKMIKKSNEYFGFLKPRMWNQYGDNHEDVCLTFDKNQLIKNSKIRYMTFDELKKDYLEIDRNYLDDFGSDEYQKMLIEYCNRMFYRKHTDYKGENEYRICSFSEDKFDYINIEDSIIGIIIFPNLINKDSHVKLINYSKKMNIPLLYLTITNNFLSINKELHSDYLKIIF